MTWEIHHKECGTLAVKTHGVGDEVSLHQDNDYIEVPIDSLCEAMLYVLTNSNLVHNDGRLAFIKTVQEMRIMPGYSLNGHAHSIAPFSNPLINDGSQRLGIVLDEPELYEDKIDGGTGKTVRRFLELRARDGA